MKTEEKIKSENIIMFDKLEQIKHFCLTCLDCTKGCKYCEFSALCNMDTNSICELIMQIIEGENLIKTAFLEEE